MPTKGAHPGSASGFSVEADPDGGVRWSAFGPAGALQGHADSRGDAEAAAQGPSRSYGGRRAQSPKCRGNHGTRGLRS